MVEIRSVGSSARSWTAACGETSRPSVNAWIQVFSGAKRNSARRWSMCECTPPYETRPSRCTLLPRSKALTSAGFCKNEPSSIDLLTRIRSWNRTRPEPIVRCPTSLLPIWPGGSPTDSPDASSVVCGNAFHSRSKFGVSASSTALPGPAGARPQPSRMTSATRGCSRPLGKSR